jgi:putative tryptophan/tyrosine transport system substrate-binding protein
MNRRAFLAGAAALLAAPLAAEAQQAGKIHRIGVLGNENNPPWDGFRRGLRDLGYVDGRNLSIEWRWSEGKPDRFPGLATEVVALKPDVIVASGTQATRAAKRATSTIPIVMTTSSYPDKIGLVDSLSRPGGNVTGLSNVGPELSGKKLELLKEIVPKASRVAVLFNPASEVEPLAVRELSAAAPAVGVEIQSVEVRSPDDFSAAFAALSPSRVHALLALGNPINFRGRQLIADFALKNRLPSIYDERLFVEAGGLMSYAPSFTDSFRRAATYVDKILKGARPADLPVEQPTKFELVINLKTAKALGLTIPPSLLARADQVIE